MRNKHGRNLVGVPLEMFNSFNLTQHHHGFSDTKEWDGLYMSNSWNQRLVNYVKAEQYKKTLELFQRVQKEGMIPDTFTLFLS
ncbi:unnamed protein product [Sphagnum jensenii]